MWAVRSRVRAQATAPPSTHVGRLVPAMQMTYYGQTNIPGNIPILFMPLKPEIGGATEERPTIYLRYTYNIPTMYLTWYAYLSNAVTSRRAPT